MNCTKGLSTKTPKLELHIGRDAVLDWDKSGDLQKKSSTPVSAVKNTATDYKSTFWLKFEYKHDGLFCKFDNIVF